MDCGLRMEDRGLWIVDCGLRCVECGLEGMECGVGIVEWGMGSGDVGSEERVYGVQTASMQVHPPTVERSLPNKPPTQ